MALISILNQHVIPVAALGLDACQQAPLEVEFGSALGDHEFLL
jgi:hypothetical protein